MTVQYEWVTEYVDAHGDVLDTDGYATLAEALRTAPQADGCQRTIVLVRDVIDIAGVEDRQWAYPTAQGLPATFDQGTKVPARFHQEYARSLDRS